MTTPEPEPRDQGAPGSTGGAPGFVGADRRPGFDSRELEARAQAFGREVEDVARRVSRDPGWSAAGDALARAWGAVVLLIGLWFVADITLRLPLPSLNWDLIWPLAVVLLGLGVLVRGAARRA